MMWQTSTFCDTDLFKAEINKQFFLSALAFKLWSLQWTMRCISFDFLQKVKLYHLHFVERNVFRTNKLLSLTVFIVTKRNLQDNNGLNVPWNCKQITRATPFDKLWVHPFGNSHASTKWEHFIHPWENHSCDYSYARWTKNVSAHDREINPP